MDFLKKNYEKVLLALVLLGLTGAVVFLIVIIPEKQSDLAASIEKKRNPRIEELAKLDLSAEEATLKRVQPPFRKLDFTTKHNLFNPVPWRKTIPDGQLIKMETGNEIGPGALIVTGIKPLYLRVEYDSFSGQSYLMRVIRQKELSARRREENTFVSMDNTTGPLKLEKVNGSPDKPGSLELVLKETSERITVTPDKPFERVDGYTANLRYPLETNLPPWENKRPNDVLLFGGGRYMIQAIHANDVVILDLSNNKKTPINLTPPR